MKRGIVFFAYFIIFLSFISVVYASLECYPSGSDYKGECEAKPNKICGDGRILEYFPELVGTQNCCFLRDSITKTKITLPSTETSCNDGIDNDCDGLVDCDDPDCAESIYCREPDEGSPSSPPESIIPKIYYTKSPLGNYSGYPVYDVDLSLTCWDRDGDGFYDIACGGTDCNDKNANIHPNAIEVCDGIDNNCDGVIDEGCQCIEGDMRACGSDVGACVSGVQKCVNGVWSGCNHIGPQPEVCDGIDNNCNGLIDENLTRVCGYNRGICTLGLQHCSNGKWSECSGIMPRKERLNNLDDDCNGIIDDPFSFEERMIARVFGEEAENKLTGYLIAMANLDVSFEKDGVVVSSKKIIENLTIILHPESRNLDSKNGVSYFFIPRLEKKATIPYLEENSRLVAVCSSVKNKPKTLNYIIFFVFLGVILFISSKIIKFSRRDINS